MKAEFRHYNKKTGRGKGTECILEYKGTTTVGKVILYHKDTFSKIKGRKYAFAKALSQLGLLLEEREKAWTWFKNNFNYKIKT